MEAKSDIEVYTRTWLTVKEWATRQLQDAVEDCKNPKLGIDMTNYARGKVAVLERLLDLPNTPPDPDTATAGMSGGQEIQGGTD